VLAKGLKTDICAAVLNEISTLLNTTKLALDDTDRVKVNKLNKNAK
jgi:hypothetical protein